ncbi:ArsR/SmtB family transcription factor [Nocardioides bruguierae]|uniref:Metalloregulator ArsR/SmtB family transcription factor n=1 Tax=Nocardioides bruguierae TaxID=2945102 RepID=A0A9X2DBH2_9ACTN|nr:metalloregulator ArsR/SmtB family transcription factor [Nocardioides bruguierae]MCL8027169.1 metalloregulator ArsR/SmtB family transcription factor [Nocardioides bruguierae]MCM0622322.1 metalloregulator ArsR/SmtB family transcription factor [Nocardioides bruguierae]
MAMNQGLDATALAAPDGAADDAAAFLFHGFADASRLRLLRHLLTGPHRVRDLTEHVGLAQSTVSRHLACLRDCGLVDSRAQGRASVFSLTHPDLVLALLGAADEVLDATGAPCRGHAHPDARPTDHLDGEPS